MTTPCRNISLTFNDSYSATDQGDWTHSVLIKRNTMMVKPHIRWATQ